MTDSQILRSNELLSRRDSRLLIVDVQEKLIPHIPVAESLVQNCRKLIEAARLLGVPVFAAEQYPKGLGATVPELAALLPERPEKLTFSSAPVLGWGNAGSLSDDRYKIIVAGLETHVCVLQTALDLISQGFRVYVPADAVASRKKLDWKIALRRLETAGATITTTESVLFECCETAAAPEFREVSRLVKE